MRSIGEPEAANVAITWKPAQRNVAFLLALGRNQSEAARESGVPLRTVQYWCAQDAFKAYVEARFERAWQHIEPGMLALLQMAIHTMRDMFLRKLSPDDPYYLEARRLVDRVLDHGIYAETAFEGSDPEMDDPVINGVFIELPPAGDGDTPEA